MKQLILNADDFGLTAGVSRGILRAMRTGLVSSTSALVCDPAAVILLGRHAKALAGRVGLHLQLTDGVPCVGSARIRSLVTKERRFPRFPADLPPLNPAEIRIEWLAQLEVFLRSGLTPSHVDTHHHVHVLPEVFDIYCEIARRCGAAARSLSGDMTKALRMRGIPCASFCETQWCGPKVSVGHLIELVEAAFRRWGGRGVMELTCHPGYVDRSLAARSVYVAERELELQILCSNQLLHGLERVGVEVVGHSVISQPKQPIGAGFEAARRPPRGPFGGAGLAR